MMSCDHTICHMISRQDEDELQQMNNVWTQRLQKLEDRRESATVKVIKWLKGNQRMFQRPILEPVCVTLNVLDKAYVNQVESFFSGRDFLSFVAQNEEDKERFLREVRASLGVFFFGGVRVSLRIVLSCCHFHRCVIPCISK